MGLLAAAACALSAWSAAGTGVRMAEGRCGEARAVAVEIDAGARFVAAQPGPSRTTAQFAAETGALVAVNGGLFDGHERPMGPSRGGGRDWPPSPRIASAGVFGAAGARAEIGPLAEWMTDAVSGWPMLVSGGKPCTRCCPRKDPICSGAWVRTAVGAGDGHVWLVVVETPGVELPALARLLAQLGAGRALNLDGGGSTSLVVNGRVVAGSTLPVPTHLGVLAR